MKGSSKLELGHLVENSLVGNTHNVTALLQKAEFQHLRTEFEKILDDYLLKSTQVREDEMPNLIHDTTNNINEMLKKAASYTRNPKMGSNILG